MHSRMKKSNIFYALFFAFLITEVSSGCSTLEFDAFASCFAKYFITEFANKPFDSWTDVETLCQDFRTSQKCMGTSVINHCANINGFTNFFSHSYDEGTAGAGRYWHVDFICGRGFEAGKNSFECIKKHLKPCFVTNCTCDVLQETIHQCSDKLKAQCGDEGYFYVYNTLAVSKCHLNPECEFLEESCNENGDYVNSISKLEKAHNRAVFSELLTDSESNLIARLINGASVQAEEAKSLTTRAIRFIKTYEKDKFSSVWLLRNVARKPEDFSELIVAGDGVPSLIKLLDSSDPELQEQAILTLGNIIGNSQKLRNFCIQHGIMDPLVKLVTPRSSPQLLRHTAWIIKNLMRYENLFLSHKDMQKLEEALTFLMDSEDMFIAVDVLWGLNTFAEGNSTNRQYLIDQGLTKAAMKFLSHPNPKVQLQALTHAISIVEGTKNQAQYLIDNEILSVMPELAKHHFPSVILLLNTLLVGQKGFVREIESAKLIPLLVSGLESSDLQCQINSMFSIFKIVALDENSIDFVPLNTVFNLFKFLAQLEAKKGRENEMYFALKISEKIFVKAEDFQTRAQVLGQIYKADGIDVLQRLQNHEDENILSVARSLALKLKELMDTPEEEKHKKHSHDEF